MEKKKSTTKSNKKGTNVNTRKNTANKVNSTNAANKTNGTKKVSTVKNTQNTPIKEEVKEVVEAKKNTYKEEKEYNMARPISTQINNDDEFAGNEIRKLLIIIGAVCAVMLSFYFITEFVLKNKKDKDNSSDTPKQETVIQYEEILMGELFNKGKEEYYVLAYVENEPYMNLYNDYIKTYNSKEGHKKIYKVNLADDFNKSYIADEAYLEGGDITKIKVTGTTLIKVIDEKVNYSYTNTDTISDKLQRLIG